MMLNTYHDFYDKKSSQPESDKLKFGVSPINECILSIFDVETQNIEEIDLKINRDLNHHGSKCLIPDGSLFYHYGSVSYIIDSMNNVKIIKSSKPSQYACSFYHDGCVYLIGGILHNSWRYNIAENRWTSLAFLNGCWTTGQVGPLFKNYAFLWGHSTNDVYIYDIIINSYSSISIPLMQKCSLVIVGNDNIFVIDRKRYMHENDGSLSDWKNLGQLSVEGCSYDMNSSPIYYKGNIYYANYYGIFKFDLMKKKLKNVKKYKTE